MKKVLIVVVIITMMLLLLGIVTLIEKGGLLQNLTNLKAETETKQYEIELNNCITKITEDSKETVTMEKIKQELPIYVQKLQGTIEIEWKDTTRSRK